SRAQPDEIPLLGWVLKGKVTDETNEPLPGVTVEVTGSIHGVTSTDLGGNYMIEVSDPNDSISFSFVGFKRKAQKVGNLRKLDVQLAADLEGHKLNEVVVVGFGTQKKVSVTGAISTVSVKELEQV